MKIGIIGHGFVGQAIESALMCDTLIVDPAKTMMTCKKLVEEYEPDYIFVCVPTPQSMDGSCDITAVDAVLADLSMFSTYSPVVVLKSTVPPHKIAKMTSYPLRLVYNPEFLRQSSSKEDILKPNMHILGGYKEDTAELEEFYSKYSRSTPCKAFHTDAKTASLTKYAINCFLATKVVFMNHLKELHEASDVQSTFEEFTEIMASDPRIGNSHMQVPGPDGKMGFGGACFPKDLKAFIDYYEKIGVGSDLLQCVDEVNQYHFRK